MAVPGHDERDFEFAEKFDLPIVEVVAAGDFAPSPVGDAFTGDGTAINSGFLDGLPTVRRPSAHHRLARGAGPRRRPGHPLQAARLALQPAALLGRALPDPPPRRRHGLAPCPRTDSCPVTLPELEDFKPSADGRAAARQRAPDWVEDDRSRDGQAEGRRRETNTMPQWAGSCWYYLRFIDPHNDRARSSTRRGRALLDAGRPLRRWVRARRAAPALRALLAQGAPRSRSS